MWIVLTEGLTWFITVAAHLEAAALNPIPTSQGRNQPLYERHVTKGGRNRVNHVSEMESYKGFFIDQDF